MDQSGWGLDTRVLLFPFLKGLQVIFMCIWFSITAMAHPMEGNCTDTLTTDSVQYAVISELANAMGTNAFL